MQDWVQQSRELPKMVNTDKKAREAWENGRLEGKVELRRLQFRSMETSIRTPTNKRQKLQGRRQRVLLD
jgi:hypothetical protein